MSVFIIAEAGVNHNGDINLAKKLVDIASTAGADAVKFQTWITDLIVTNDAKQAQYQEENTKRKSSQYEMLKNLELSYNDFQELKMYCDTKNIIFLSTPDESTSADFLNNLQNIFKIGSGELTNITFLKHIAKFDKEVILSTGMGNIEEVENALNALVTSGLEKDKITLLHATSMYPTEMEDVNLKAMQTMQNDFDIKVGYSDHTLGIEVPIAAVAMGACVIEKHFTLSKDLEGPDHKASLDPIELKLMIEKIRNIEIALGDGIKEAQKSELDNIDIVRKVIVAKKEIKKGELFSVKNLTVKRAGSGISADQFESFFQKKAKYDFTVDEIIRDI